jgi:hypothetical protein
MTFQYLVGLRWGAAIAAVLALAGCGAAAASTNDPSPGTTRSGTSVPDAQIVRDARLRLTDFPSGWTASPLPAKTTLTGCQGVNGAKAAVRARMSSQEFLQSRAHLEAESAAYVYADAATARHWFAELTSSQTRECFGRALVKGVSVSSHASGVTIGPIRARDLAIAPIGDQAAASRVSIRISTVAASVDADADLVFVRVDRGLVLFVFGAVQSPFDHTLDTRLVRTVTGRLATDLGRSP